MKSILILIFSVANILSAYHYSIRSKETCTLTIESTHLRSSRGVVQFALYNKDGTIPDEHFRNYYKILKTKIKDGTAVIEFKDLPKGIYAINVLHDENENGKIDRGFLFPKEGIGFSNYTSIGPSQRPKFSKACFDLQEDKKITIKMIYF